VAWEGDGNEGREKIWGRVRMGVKWECTTKIGPQCNIFNPLTGMLKLQSNGPLYSNTVIGKLTVDGWAVTFGTARRGLDRLRCTKCNSQPINGQCTNFILFDVSPLNIKGLISDKIHNSVTFDG